MLIDYVAEFPITGDLLPHRLHDLLAPIKAADPALPVAVTTRREKSSDGPAQEFDQMIMIAVPEEDLASLGIPRAASDGVVSFSTPDVRHKGGLRAYNPSTVDGHDPIVASLGCGSFYSYTLSEKVWMALGLSSRLVGGEGQRIVYDDLSVPVFGVAEGETTAQHYFKSSRDVCWTMSNTALRRYLWMRGLHGVRTFYYKALLPDEGGLRTLMGGKGHVVLKPDAGWYELDIREFDGGLLIQVWAAVVAVPPALCDEPTADGLIWPGWTKPMTHDDANALVDLSLVHLDDRFLERYEQNDRYDAIPVVDPDGQWHCSPSYLGQWGFSGCVRVGRNLIRVPMRELYKPKPDREIIHAHAHAVSPTLVGLSDPAEEHMPAKTARLVAATMNLGDLFAQVSREIGKNRAPEEIVKLSRTRLQTEGFRDYPELVRLSQVAPLDMTEQAFLSRCKRLHEFWQRIPNGILRDLVLAGGHRKDAVKSFGSLKLLQALTNIAERLNGESESVEAFGADPQEDDLTYRNPALAALFVNNDLRIADAHESGGTLVHLERLGVDPATLNDGYGRALDIIYDGVIDVLEHLGEQFRTLLA
ncbi:hypothetical protein [Alterinioella nitratireducens]|uniref:hypothetical protein n=1 Tax=Alterinioella nitratireducens TaxID=2735915 RepID=UPI0015534D63|nr:hypothetical protein [Alterinioella nitratireducens]NPD18848.1 hypothetical protein [Alterinioella nitratireducens]